MAKETPKQLTIRSYQVGFGDCFLLTFRYESGDKHVLIDFGSTGKPKNAPTLLEIAQQIQEDTQGKLTALIASHRHADHINGFATKNNKASGDIIRTLEPELIVQPWTENPDTPKEARGPKVTTSRMTQSMAIAGLQSMHAIARGVQGEVQRLQPYLSKSVAKQLAFLGEENLANLSAVKNLMEMGKGPHQAEYLKYGDKTKLETLLPGVSVHVLGPPTPEQYPDIQKQRSKDASEFWHIMGVTTKHTAATDLNPFPDAEHYGAEHPPSTRWLVGRVRALHGAQRLALVRALDDAMNNTSLILLFEVGRKKLLFPGDAQIENWSYALHDSKEAGKNCELLAETDFYKVGHHGSLNATPKSLWKLFKKKGDEHKKGRMKSAVSTMAGKHGSNSSKTEVPRRTLVQALQQDTAFSTTQKITKKDKNQTITYDF
jgi:hypothetical protein